MDLSDRQLLEQFAARREEGAFAALLERHGPMIFGVCRRVLHHHPDAEDAFQATFLVLAHKAASIRRRDSVAGWLYGVAYRLACRLKTRAAVRREKERVWAEAAGPALNAQRLSTDLISTVIWRELRPVLDEELNRLPDKYRNPLLLCYFEGKTHEEAAAALGWSKGSMSRRIDKARQLLRVRLARRGVTLSSGLLFAVIAQHVASAAVPASIAASTVRAALLITAGRAAVAGLISTQVALLTEGVLKAMLVSKLKVALAAVLAVGLVGAGAGVLGQRAGSVEEIAQEKGEGPAAKPPTNDPPTPEPAQKEPAEKPFAVPPRDLKSRAAEIRYLLEVPTDRLRGGMNVGTPLRDVIDSIARLHGVMITINDPQFEEVSEKGIVDKLTTQVVPGRGLALRKVLEDALRRIDGPAPVQATYLVRGTHIEIVPFHRAQPQALLRELVNVTFREKPLQEALEQLVDLSGANIMIDPRIGEFSKTPVNAVLQHVPLDTAVELLSDMAELQSIVLDNVLYVTTPENAAKLQKRMDAEWEKIGGPKTPPFTPGGLLPGGA